MGQYDLRESNVTEHFVGSIDLPNNWNIGLIVGRSGSGKTTIARELFGDCIVSGYEWTHDNILDDMPKDVSIKDITKTLTSVGFSSPPLMDEKICSIVKRRKNALRNSSRYFRKQRYVRIR